MGSPAILGYQPRPLGLDLRPKQPARRLVYGLLFVLAVLSYLCYAHPKTFKDKVWRSISEAVLYAQQHTRYNSKPTQLEQHCFDGTMARANENNLTNSIPGTVHLISTGSNEIPFKLYLAIWAALISTGIISVHLHHDTVLNSGSTCLRLLQPNLTPIRFDCPDYPAEVAAYHLETWSGSYQTDAMRLHILHGDGGIYLDSDAYIPRPGDHLLRGARDACMGHEGRDRWGLCDGVIVANAGAPFIARWLDEYDTFDDSQWNYHSLHLPTILAKRHPEDVCALPSARALSSSRCGAELRWTGYTSRWMGRRLMPLTRRLRGMEGRCSRTS